MVLALLTGFFLVGCGENTPEDTTDRPPKLPNGESRVVVNFGHVPSVSSSEKLSQLEPLEDYLESKLPIDIQIRFAQDYSEVIERVNNDEYDFVTFGPLSYVSSAEQGNVVPALKPIRFGDTSYRSIIFTAKDSGVKALEDLENKTFAFVDKKSASGYLFPRAYLMKHGINPDQDLSGYFFRGSHSNVVVSVWLGDYAAGAVYDDAREDQDNAERIVEETRVLARTDPIPNEPWIFRKGFVEKHPELVEKITQLMLNLNKSASREQRILERLGVDGFILASDTDYDTVREYQDFLPGSE